MGVYTTWTDDDKKNLKKYYIKYGSKEAAKMLGRTYAATRQEILRLGYNNPEVVKTWKYDELEYLKRAYPKYGPQRVANRLGRSYKSVQSKANKLGICYWDRSKRFPTWTDYQLAYLKKNFANMTNETIGKNIKKSPDAVRDTARRLGLKKNKPHIWTAEEEEKLISMVKRYKIDTISRSLNKPRQTVINKMRELSLKEGNGEDRLKPSEVAEILGISAQTVRNYCAQNNRVSDYEKFHGKKYYKMTVPQIIRFMVDKIDLWIDKNYDLSYIGILFIDFYSSFYCKEEIEIIKRRVEEKQGHINWPERIRMTGARAEGIKNIADGDTYKEFEFCLDNDFFLDYEEESII